MVKKSLSVFVASAMMMSLAVAPARAQGTAGVQARGCASAQAAKPAPGSYEELLAALDRAAQARTSSEAAAILFPDDAAARAEVAQRLDEAERAIRPLDGKTQTAVPAVLVPFLVLLGKCVVGALGGAAVNELITLVHQGKKATAEARVYAMVGGCITSVVPPALRPLAKKAQRPIAAAVLSIIIRWNS